MAKISTIERIKHLVAVRDAVEAFGGDRDGPSRWPRPEPRNAPPLRGDIVWEPSDLLLGTWSDFYVPWPTRGYVCVDGVVIQPRDMCRN